ncbi:MAG: hypothetical protein HQL29_02470 [Candidatus Omnitrophica bacterium]|nr:hypothetical protein [Candidatus Omnitrophota bacterium]
MKNISRVVILVSAVLFGCLTATAEMMPIEPGTVEVYVSDNGRYEVSIVYGDGFPSWSLKEDGLELWSEPMPAEAGAVTIADNGETIILPLWGWRDEGGSSGVAVYNKEGKLVRNIFFKSINDLLMSEETLRWVRVTKISPDGKYFAIGGNGQENSTVTLFEAASGNVVWDKTSGLPDIVDIAIAKDGEHVLAATREDNDTGMEFVLFDREGNVLWNKKIDKNLSYDVEHYVKFKDDASGFEIYDLKLNEYVEEKIKK